MKLLNILNEFLHSRKSWSLLFCLSLFCVTCSISFQHILKLYPCPMCIWERISMLLLCVSAGIVIFNPKNDALVGVGLLGWAASSYKGLILAIEHVEIQTNIFSTCSLLHFTFDLPLDKWLPQVFAAPGDCSEVAWTLLGFSMEQWLITIFSLFLTAATLFAGVYCASLMKLSKTETV